MAASIWLMMSTNTCVVLSSGEAEVMAKFARERKSARAAVISSASSRNRDKGMFPRMPLIKSPSRSVQGVEIESRSM